jgi:hypothetical protein
LDNVTFANLFPLRLGLELFSQLTNCRRRRRAVIAGDALQAYDLA